MVYFTETHEEIEGAMVPYIKVREVRYQVVKIQRKEKDKKRLAFFPSTSKSNRSTLGTTSKKYSDNLIQWNLELLDWDKSSSDKGLNQ